MFKVSLSLLFDLGMAWVHTAHCTLHTAHYTLHNAHRTLHTAHCTLHIHNECKSTETLDEVNTGLTYKP